MPKWAAGIGVALLPVLLVGAGALFPEQSWRAVLLEALFSVAGVALTTLAVQRLTTAKVAYKSLLVIAIPLILLLIFVGLVIRVKHQSEAAQLSAQHSREIGDVAETLRSQVSEMESAARGYMVTSDDTFVNFYGKSLESIAQTTRRLRMLVSNDPQQEARATQIEQLTDQKTEYLSYVVGLIRANDQKQIAQVINRKYGVDLMNQLHAEMATFAQEQARRDTESRQRMDASWQRLSWLLVAGTAAAILLASILALLFSGGISRRLQQLRDNAVSLAAGQELAARLTGNDEIAELDRVFHEMAVSLDEVTRREKAVIEGTTDGIFVKDLNRRFLMINQSGAALLGRPVEEIIGATGNDVLEPESARRADAADDEVLREGQPATCELVLTTKAGVKRTYWTTRSPYRDRLGNIVGLIGINRDITERKQSEQALATSEKRYRALVDDGHGLISTHDLDGKLLSVNPAAAGLLGYTTDEMVGRNLVDYITPELQYLFPQYLQRIRSEPSVEGLLHILNIQGEERIWMYSNTRITEPGAAAYVLGYAQDVTDNKRAEEKLWTLTQRLSLATRVGDIGVWDWDLTTDSINWDERMFDIYGIARGTAIDFDRWRATVVPEDMPVAVAAMQQAIERKSQEVAEFRIIRADGSLRHVQTAQGVILDVAGEVARVIGLNVDITERKLVAAELAASETLLKQFVAHTPAATAMLDTEMRYLQVSDRWLTDYNLVGQNIIGKSHYEVFPDIPERWKESHRRSLAGAIESCAEDPFPRADGTTEWLQWETRPWVKVGEQIGGIIFFTQVITARKLIEIELERARDAALESVRLKAEFLANMSHEIRTPMNGVIGMTDLLLETEQTSSQREYTETIQSSGEALLTIINDILDFSKIEAGLLRFEKIDFELRGSVEGTIEQLAERAQAKGLELASLVYRDVPTALVGDPGRLRQVLTNLVGNAVKFTERGEVVIRVKRVSETASHATLRFEVQDTGIGIAEEAQRGLFRAFSQADGATMRKYGGTGLGLAISKQLVEYMGGEIGIESKAGAGSVFWFTAEYEKQSETVAPNHEDHEMDRRLAGARVLIVDDNATARGILNYQASSWKMIVAEAESGTRALELLRAAAREGQPYDVAILDLLMPDLNGSQLAEAIKADPSIVSVALVVMPMFGKRAEVEEALHSGVVDYLQKPVRQSKLHDCLTAAMNGGGAPAPSRLAERPSNSPDAEQQKMFSHIRIIVADDNVVNQKVALRQLFNLGYNAEAVSNGRELLTVLENREVDLILMDCQMPVMDGFQATAEIRRHENAGRHTTIIAMTANALDGDDLKCLEAGMDDYLSKPVKMEVLRQKLERWIGPNEPGAELDEHTKPTQSTRDRVIEEAQLTT